MQVKFQKKCILIRSPSGPKKKTFFLTEVQPMERFPLRRLFHNGVYNLTNTVSGIAQEQRDKQQNANYVCFMYVL